MREGERGDKEFLLTRRPCTVPGTTRRDPMRNLRGEDAINIPRSHTEKKQEERIAAASREGAHAVERSGVKRIEETMNPYLKLWFERRENSEGFAGRGNIRTMKDVCQNRLLKR